MGFSSLASLEQLPLTRVKLDCNLIATIDTSARSLAIARAIIGLGHSLGLQVTAEGVERPEQLLPLLGHRAVYLQGYLVCAPVAGQELLAAIAGYCILRFTPASPIDAGDEAEAEEIFCADSPR